MRAGLSIGDQSQSKRADANKRPTLHMINTTSLSYAFILSNHFRKQAEWDHEVSSHPIATAADLLFMNEPRGLNTHHPTWHQFPLKYAPNYTQLTTRGSTYGPDFPFSSSQLFISSHFIDFRLRTPRHYESKECHQCRFKPALLGFTRCKAHKKISEILVSLTYI